MKSLQINSPAASSSSANSGSVDVPRYPSRYYDWFATIRVDESQFVTSGYVHLFLCETVPPGDWMHAPERVGVVAIFKSAREKSGDYSHHEATVQIITGQVPLTRALWKKGLDISRKEDVEGYLKTHIHWRCGLIDGTEVPLAEVPSLQVKVFSALTEKSNDGGFPTRQEPELHRSITHGKVGGYSIESD